jgi:hypothetical protein
MLRDMCVSTLVRLGATGYDAGPMVARGIRMVDLPCADDTHPPNAVVEGFIRAVDAAPGAVAVHCTAGRGQTGTLAALYLMRSHRFSAREAMGWLRVMRGGSVVGEQQRFLCDVGAALDRLRSSSRSAVAANGEAAHVRVRVAPTAPLHRSAARVTGGGSVADSDASPGPDGCRQGSPSPARGAGPLESLVCLQVRDDDDSDEGPAAASN